MQNTELFPKSEIDGIISAEAAIRSIMKAMIESSDAVDKVRKGILDINQPLRDRIQDEKLLSAIDKEVAKSESDLFKIYAQMSPAMRALNQEKAAARLQSAANARELKMEAKEANATANSLDALTARLSQLKIAAKTLDIDTPEFKRASADILELNTRISTAEQSMGVFGRNVGNYTSGFTALGFQVQQLAREVPSVTQGFSMLFRAVSNNLPMFFDEVSKARTEFDAYKKAVADGIDAPKVVSPMKQIISSILSWQTLLVVGITLLTAYGDEIIGWIEGLFGAEKQLSATAMRQKALNELQAEAVKSTSDEIIKLELLYTASQDVFRSMDERTAAVDELQKLYPDYLGNISDEAILAGDAASAYDALKKSIVEVAIARAAADKIAENEVKRAEELQALNDDPKQASFGDKFVAAGMLQLGMDPRERLAESAAEVQAKAVAKVNDQYDKQRQTIESLIDVRKLLDSDNNAPSGLISTQEKLLEQARAMPEATEAEIKAKNQRIKTIETEIERLRSLGIETDKSTASTASTTETTHRTRMGALNAERKAIEDLSTAEIDARMGVIERTLSADQTATADRMTLTNELYDLEEQRIKQLADVQRANLIEKNIDENTTYNKDGSVASTIDEVTAAENVKNQLVLLQIATDQAMIDSVNDRLKEINALEDRGIEDNIRAFEMQMRERARIIDQDESAELAALSAQYSGVFSNQQEYEDKRLAITRKYADLREQTSLEALETQLAELKKDGNITIAEQQKIADLEAEIADYKVEVNRNANDRIIEDDERAREKRIAMLESIKENATGILSSIVEAAGIASQKQIDDLEQQSKDNSDAAEEEQARIERLAEAGAISEEQKNARIELSKQQASAKEEQLDLRRRQLQARQARYEQGLALFQTAINGGVAISKAFAELGPIAGAIAAIAVGAAIAVQVATIASTKVPAYARGTEDHPGGPAWVGDGGRAEAVIYGGKVYKTPAIPTLMDLPKGAEVLPDWRDVIKNSLVHDLVTEPRVGVTNYYDVPNTAYNDKGVRLRLDKQIDQTERLIREIRKGRKADKVAEFRSRKLIGIN